MTEKVREILELLDIHYKEETKCHLDYKTPHELLIATMLSAQCTDARVNIVTASLFKKYKSITEFANADLRELENDIRSTGFYHNKAKNIISASKSILRDYGGEIPSEIEELIKLDGVGRKTANVVRGHIFKIPSIVVDTHVKRISNKLGIVESSDPEKIEFELMRKLPKDNWIRYNTQIIVHGRNVCKARNPECNVCFLENLCPSAKP